MLPLPRTLTMLVAMVLTAFAVDGAPAQSKADRSGDPLPDGALARMGTLRFRHADIVNFVAYVGADQLLTAGFDNIIRLWDRGSGAEIRRFALAEPVEVPQTNPGMAKRARPSASGRRLVKVAMSEDGRIVAALLVNNEVQLWQVATGNEIRRIKPARPNVTSILFSPDSRSLALRMANRSVFIVKTATGAEISRIGTDPLVLALAAKNPVDSETSGFAFARDSRVLATAEVEIKKQVPSTYVLLSDAKTGKEIRRIDTPNGAGVIAYSPDRKLVAFAFDRVIQVREADTGNEVREIEMPLGCNAMQFAPDSKSLAAKGQDLAIRLLDVNSGAMIHEFADAPGSGNPNAFNNRGAINDVMDFAFSSDGKELAVASGPSLRFWNVSNGKEQPRVGHSGPVSNVVLTPDRKTLLSRGLDRTIRRWDAASGQQLAQFPEPKGTIACAFSPDGRTIALSNVDGTTRLLASVDGTELRRLSDQPNGATGLAFSADSKMLATRGGASRIVRIFDVAQGKELGRLTFNPPIASARSGDPVDVQTLGGQAVAFSADSKFLAANADSQSTTEDPNGAQQVALSTTMHLWEIATRREIRQIPLSPGRTWVNLAFSPDGRLLAVESADQTISLVEIASGKERTVLGAATSSAPAKTPNGFVAANGRVTRGKGAFNTLAFASGGAVIFGRGPDNSVRAWDVDFAKELGSFTGHASEVQAIGMAADGKSLATGSADTTALVWDLSRVKREPKATGVVLQSGEIQRLWTDLLGNDGAKAHASILRFASGSKQTVAFLGEHLKPASPVDAKMVADSVRDLGSTNFQIRSKAFAQLDKLGDLALPALRAAFDSNPSLETRRRMEPLIEKLTTSGLNAEQIRLVRALEVLERIGAADAGALLDALAKGAPGALMTREAQAALANLDRHAR